MITLRGLLKNRKAAGAARDAVASPAPACRPVPAQADPRAMASDVARTMLQAAVRAFREEVRKGACEQRVAEARAAMVFWRERLEALMQGPRP